MSDFDFDLDGATSLKEEFGDRIDDWSGGGSVFVGTAVEYALYLEYGTSKMDPKPFFRPAVAELQADIEGFIDAHTNSAVDTITSAEELVETIGLALERRIKEIITSKGLIDTGTLRASIRAVDSRGSLLAAEDVDVNL
jgi:hypothetical protein